MGVNEWAGLVRFEVKGVDEAVRPNAAAKQGEIEERVEVRLPQFEAPARHVFCRWLAKAQSFDALKAGPAAESGNERQAGQKNAHSGGASDSPAKQRSPETNGARG